MPPNTMLQDPRPPERFLEMHRLAYIVKTIDRAVAVVPKGALIVEVMGESREFYWLDAFVGRGANTSKPPSSRGIRRSG